MTSTMIRALAASTQAHVPTLIWGEPGEAKTAKLTDMFTQWGYHVEVLTGNNREATDFLGPTILDDDGYASYATYRWVKRLTDAEKAVLILDEFNTSRDSVMNAMLRIIQERWVGEVKLPDTVHVIAIANPPESATFSAELRPPIANRFFHITWDFDADEWLTHMATGFTDTHVAPLEDLTTTETVYRENMMRVVTEYLKTSRHALNPGVPKDPTLASGAWASPRSWTNLARTLSCVPIGEGFEETRARIATGCVGEENAMKFLSWCRSRDLYDPAEAIANPETIPWDTARPDALFALLSAVASIGEQAGEADNTTTWRKAILVTAVAADHGFADIAMPAVRALWRARPEGVGNKIPRPVKNAYTELFVQSGKITA